MECPECLKNNSHTTLKPYQINLHQAIYMCPNKNCASPMPEWKTINQNLFNDNNIENDSTDSDIETITKIITTRVRKKIRKRSRFKNLSLGSIDSEEKSSNDEETLQRAYNIFVGNIGKNVDDQKVNELLGCDKLSISDSSDDDFNFSDDLLNLGVNPQNLTKESKTLEEKIGLIERPRAQSENKQSDFESVDVSLNLSSVEPNGPILVKNDLVCETPAENLIKSPPFQIKINVAGKNTFEGDLKLANDCVEQETIEEKVFMIESPKAQLEKNESNFEISVNESNLSNVERNGPIFYKSDINLKAPAENIVKSPLFQIKINVLGKNTFEGNLDDLKVANGSVNLPIISLESTELGKLGTAGFGLVKTEATQYNLPSVDQKSSSIQLEAALPPDKPVQVQKSEPKNAFKSLQNDLERLKLLTSQRRLLNLRKSQDKLGRVDKRILNRSKRNSQELTKIDISAALKASGVVEKPKVDISAALRASGVADKTKIVLKPVNVIKGQLRSSRRKPVASNFEGFQFTTKVIKPASPKKISQEMRSIVKTNIGDNLSKSLPDVNDDLNLSIQNESFSLDKCNISNLDELLNDIDLDNSNLSQINVKNLEDVDDWLKSLVN